jgi:hypothetical protein
MYVCTGCNGPKGCTILEGVPDRLPLICGPDNNGYTFACNWRAVPDRDTKNWLKEIFPFK